jgi:hypothetical protein
MLESSHVSRETWLFALEASMKTQRRDYATFWLLGVPLLLVTSPVWLVIVVGLLAPLLIAAFLVAIPIGVVYSAFRK